MEREVAVFKTKASEFRRKAVAAGAWGTHRGVRHTHGGRQTEAETDTHSKGNRQVRRQTHTGGEVDRGRDRHTQCGRQTEAETDEVPRIESPSP